MILVKEGHEKAISCWIEMDEVDHFVIRSYLGARVFYDLSDIHD